MVAICPCCHQTVRDNEFLVSFETNQASRFGKDVALLPQEIFILKELNTAYPAAARHEALIYALYGYSRGPDDPKRVIHVVMSRLRKKLRPLHVKIHMATTQGYRLEMLPAHGDY